MRQVYYRDANNPVGINNRMFVYCEECGTGTVIGLEPNSNYWVNVTVFNTAGTSVPSEKYLVSTYEARM